MKIESGIRLAIIALLCAVLAVAVGAAEARVVHGTVVDSNGEPIKGAVVQMKNLQTLMIRSFITQDDGRFQFTGMNPDADYEIQARYRGRWSRTKTVSQFDSSRTVDVALKVDTRPD